MVDLSPYVPDRGDVVWLSFNPNAGHEQAGRRPALVLSPKIYNEKVGLGVFCPISNQIKGYPFEVIIPPGFSITGCILSDQVKSLDWVIRKATYIESLPVSIIKEVIEKVSLLLL